MNAFAIQSECLLEKIGTPSQEKSLYSITSCALQCIIEHNIVIIKKNYIMRMS